MFFFSLNMDIYLQSKYGNIFSLNMETLENPTKNIIARLPPDNIPEMRKLNFNKIRS